MPDISEYFSARADGRIVRVKLVGFWHDSLTETIKDAVYAAYSSAVDSIENKPFITIADCTEFAVPGKLAVETVGRCMRYGVEHGMYKAVEVVPRVATELGLAQAERQSGRQDFRILAKDLDQAEAIAKDLLKHYRSTG